MLLLHSCPRCAGAVQDGDDERSCLYCGWVGYVCQTCHTARLEISRKTVFCPTCNQRHSESLRGPSHCGGRL